VCRSDPERVALARKTEECWQGLSMLILYEAGVAVSRVVSGNSRNRLACAVCGKLPRGRASATPDESITQQRNRHRRGKPSFGFTDAGRDGKRRRSQIQTDLWTNEMKVPLCRSRCAHGLIAPSTLTTVENCRLQEGCLPAAQENVTVTLVLFQPWRSVWRDGRGSKAASVQRFVC